MFYSLRKLPAVFLVCVLGAGPCLTWSQAPDASEDPEKIVNKGVRFICMEIAKGTPDSISLVGKRDFQDVTLSTRSPGRLFAVPPTGSIALGIETGDPENPLIPIALGQMPPNVARGTALLIPRSPKPDGMKYEMFIIPDDKLVGGSAYFLNLTRSICVAKLDEQILKMTPGEPVVYQPKDLDQSRNSSVAIVIETKEGEQRNWRPLMSSTWRLRPTRIEVCIVYWNEAYKRPSIKGFTLFPISNEAMN